MNTMMSDHYLDLEWRLDNNLTPRENEDVMRQGAAEGRRILFEESLYPKDWENHTPFENPEEQGRDSQW